MRWNTLTLSLPVCGLLTAALASAAAATPKPDAEGSEFFEKKIRPVLTERCYQCHSAQSEKLKGGLLLDSRAGLLKGGDDGPVIVPHEPEKSLLIKAIRYADKDLQMPPKHQLSEEQVNDFIAWVKMGAPDPREPTGPAAAGKSSIDFAAAKKFWSFQPVKDSAPPAIKNKR